MRCAVSCHQALDGAPGEQAWGQEAEAPCGLYSGSLIWIVLHEAPPGPLSLTPGKGQKHCPQDVAFCTRHRLLKFQDPCLF